MNSFLIWILRRFYLFLLILRSHFFAILFSTAAIPLVLSLLLAGYVFLRPVKTLLKQKMHKQIPSTWVKASSNRFQKPNTLLQFFQKELDVQYGISEKLTQKILRWPEVKKVYKTQVLQKPASASLKHPLLGVLGAGFRFDIMIQGVSEAILKKYTVQSFRSFWGPKKHAPKKLLAYIPETYAQLVTSYALVNGLPVVDLKEIPNLKLELFIGESIMRPAQKEVEKQLAPIAGYLPAEFISAVGVPLRFVQQFHKKHQMFKAARSYDQIFVQVKSATQTRRVIQRLKKLGLKVDAPSKQNYQALIRAVDSLALAEQVLVFLLGIILMAVTGNAFMGLTERHKYEYGLFLMSGSSGFFVWGMVFTEGFLWGFLYAFLSWEAVEKLLPLLGDLMPAQEFLQQLWQMALRDFPQGQWLISSGIGLLCGMSAWLPSFLFIGRSPLHLIRKG